MNKVKILVEVELASYEAIPIVARWLNLPSDAQTAEVASMIFDSLIADAFMEATAGHAAVEFAGTDVGEAVDALLDPNVSLPITLKILTQMGGKTGLTLGEQFEEYEKEDPNDIWVKSVQAKTEDNIIWRIALATVYQHVHRDSRSAQSTWKLIEKTYHLFKKGVDNGADLEENHNSPPGENNPSNHSKE